MHLSVCTHTMPLELLCFLCLHMQDNSNRLYTLYDFMLQIYTLFIIRLFMGTFLKGSILAIALSSRTSIYLWLVNWLRQVLSANSKRDDCGTVKEEGNYQPGKEVSHIIPCNQVDQRSIHDSQNDHLQLEFEMFSFLMFQPNIFLKELVVQKPLNL